MKVSTNEACCFTCPAEAGLDPSYLLQMRSHIASIASWFPVFRAADAMVTDCKLLAVLWSGNDNELCQLQVHICSVIHHCSFVLYKDNTTHIRNPNRAGRIVPKSA
jgi:hypothetical protein